MEPVFDLDWEDGLLLIEKISQKEQDEALFQRWISGGEMSYQSQMTFEAFKAQVQSKATSKNDNRSVEDILKKVKSIIG